MGIPVTVPGSPSFVYFEAIPISKATLLSYSSQATFTATKDCLLYLVSTDTVGPGIVKDGKYIKGILAGGFFVRGGESVTLQGDFLLIESE